MIRISLFDSESHDHIETMEMPALPPIGSNIYVRSWGQDSKAINTGKYRVDSVDISVQFIKAPNPTLVESQTIRKVGDEWVIFSQATDYQIMVTRL